MQVLGLMRAIGLASSVFLLATTAAANDKADAYGLNPGDAVSVSVWREEGLQKDVRVLPDGSITFPLAGRVPVAGLDVAEAATRIEQKLKAFIPEPIVTLVIMATEGNRVFVVGKVLKPGPYVMTGPTTVLQALSMAGGLDRFAKESAIKVLRTQDGKQDVLAVDYADLLSGSNLSSNVLLKAGDTLLVP